MKLAKRILSVCLIAAMLLGTIGISASAYTVGSDLQSKLDNIYKENNYAIGWGIYDISGSSAELVAGYNENASFQSNCTIKPALLLCICKMIDKGELSLNTKLPVDKSSLHYSDFPGLGKTYSVRNLLSQMIKYSNNACYEVLLRYVTLDAFNAFLGSLGSGTRVPSYAFMGNCTPNNRAVEWYAIYKYCHSGAKTSGFAWNTLCNAFKAPIRTALVRSTAHKAGWYTQGGTASDCAVVKSSNGGCYLMIIFTKNNGSGGYNMGLVRKLAKVLDGVWNEYYRALPADSRRKASF